jgi:hypothetical protein
MVKFEFESHLNSSGVSLKRKEKEIRKKESASPHRPPSPTCAEAQFTPHRLRPASIGQFPSSPHRPPRIGRFRFAIGLPEPCLLLSLSGSGPTCQRLPSPLLLSFFPDAHRPPEISGEALALGPHAKGAPPPYK